MLYFLIAKIDKSFGQHGDVSLISFLKPVENYTQLKKVYIDFWGDRKTFYIENAQVIRGKIIFKLKKFDTLRDSQVLIGREVFIDESDRKVFPGNQININDLIGSEVFVEGKEIGFIREVMKTNANDVLVIEDREKKEILIPFVLNFIEKFNADEKKLILNITKEFFESNED